jgi:preprotein translocase subunit Sec61beta
MFVHRFVGAVAVVFSLAVAGAQEAPRVERVSNWTAPPYWTPQKQKPTDGSPGETLSAMGALPTSPMPFTAIAPCRVVDTRNATGPYGGPSLVGNGPARIFNIPAGPCLGIPSDAGAYSINVAAILPAVDGFMTVFPTGFAQPTASDLNYLGGEVIANALIVPAGTSGSINVFVNTTTDMILDINGYYRTAPVVNTLNALAGDVTLAAGSNISITPTGQTLTIAATNVDATSLGGQPPSFYDLAPSPPTDNSLTPIDTTGNVGQDTSLITGADGLGLISYQDDTNLDLKVAHCSDTLCTSATITPLDTTGAVGFFTSVTIGADGLGLISYYDLTNGDLKVAHCSNTLCTSATLTPLDTTGNVGQYTSVAIGADGLGLISYYNAADGNLKVAHCSNAACTSATITPLHSPADNVGLYTSIAIGADGRGLISYYDETNGDLKVAHCFDLLCSTAQFRTPDSQGDVGNHTSVTIGTDGLGLISYHDDTNSDLKVAHCSDTICDGATLATLDSLGSVGRDTAVTIGTDGLGLISYFDGSNGDLKVAHCSNVSCTAAAVSALDTTVNAGRYTSLTIGADGLGLISYYANCCVLGDLKVAHCSNALCAPFFRRR